MTESASPAQPARVVSLDVARGALMAYIIVIIHGVFWLRLLPQATGSILLFEMPPIFMITGAAYALATRVTPPGGNALVGYGGFLLRRGVRILAPYWAYALVCAALMLAVGGETDVGATLAAWLNPVRGGAGHSTLTLNWHLWFVAPFLVVTALLPLLSRVRTPRDVPLWVWAALGTTLVFAADLLDASRIGAAQMVVFYALWAIFGYGLAAAPRAFHRRDYIVVLVFALAALAGAALAFPDAVSLDMQANKFPPNALFFLFSCAWVSLLLIVIGAADAKHIAALADNPLLKPFTRAGYSIYLWQGLGYAAALMIGRRFHLDVLAVWAIAVTLTLILGLLAAPIERLRLR
jgi:peptidoglycan/LPS O-acetylase OafA/YrhL